MTAGLVKRIIERGWAEPIRSGGQHSSLLNALFLAGMREAFEARLAEVLDKPIITHPNLSDSLSRVRPLILGGHARIAAEAVAFYKTQRIEVAGVPMHTTAPSTRGWVFADTAYMVPPSLAIAGDVALAVRDLVGIHGLMANESGLLRHVLNASVRLSDSYERGQDLWIDGTTWCRANGWWMAGAVDAMEVMDAPDPALLECFRKTSAALLALQGNGIWHCTVDDEYAPEDTSGTVMIAYGFAKAHRLGLLDDTYRKAAEKTLEGVLTRHFDLATGTLRHQQIGPLIINVASTNPRYLCEGNPYGQGFLAQLYCLCVEDVRLDARLARLEGGGSA